VAALEARHDGQVKVALASGSVAVIVLARLTTFRTACQSLPSQEPSTAPKQRSGRYGLLIRHSALATDLTASAAPGIATTTVHGGSGSPIASQLPPNRRNRRPIAVAGDPPADVPRA
jgi:hypothetical protein